MFNFTFFENVLRPDAQKQWHGEIQDFAKELANPNSYCVPMRKDTEMSKTELKQFKLQLPNFSPAIFDGSRSKSNVKHLTALCYDIDNKAKDGSKHSNYWDFDETNDWIQKSGYEGIAYATPTSEAEHNKQRVIFSLSRPVLPSEWAQFVQGANDELGISVPWELGVFDHCTLDPSRTYFFHGAIEKDQIRVEYIAGKALNVDDLLRRYPVIAKPDNPEQISVPPSGGHLRYKALEEEYGLGLKDLDLRELLINQGLLEGETQPDSEDRFRINCPWNPEHTNDSWAYFQNEERKWPNLGCNHNSCNGKWLKDYLDQLDKPEVIQAVKSLATELFGEHSWKAAMSYVESNELSLDELNTTEFRKAVSSLELNALEFESLRNKLADRFKISKTAMGKYLTHDQDERGAPCRDIDYANLIIKRLGKDNLIHNGSLFYRWLDKGIWAPIKDDIVRKEIIEDLEEGMFEKYSSSKVDSILKLIISLAFDENLNFSQIHSTINCANGTIKFDENFNPILEAHDRKSFHLTLVPQDYVPNGSSKFFLETLRQIFDGDEGRVNMYLELLGLTLLESCPIPFFVILVGKTANGKSMLLNVMESVVGSSNVSAVCPSDFDARFQLMPMFGKLLNITPELRVGATIPDGKLKQLSSGDPINFEHKGKDSFKARNTASIWMATNHPPKIRDTGPAIRRRAFIIPFDRIFLEEEQDRELAIKLASEGPGIFSMAVEACSRALRRNGVTVPIRASEVKDSWLKEQNAVALYLEDRCVRDGDALIGCGELYRDFKSWADEMGMRQVMTQWDFIRDLQSQGFTKKRQAKGTVILGLRLNEGGEMDQAS